MRLRLHTCAAYLRKYTDFEDVNKSTKVTPCYMVARDELRAFSWKPSFTLRADGVENKSFSHALERILRSKEPMHYVPHAKVQLSNVQYG